MKSRTLILFLTLHFAGGTTVTHSQEASDSITRELREVMVKASQPATRLVGSTLVSTIPGSNLADLGNALDVLSQLPMINVDDNTVSVTGRRNIEILIDGRPLRDDTELQRILSADLKRVELLMAPGAAYESTTDAVLKIITRRRFTRGLSVTDQFTINKRRRWSVTDYLATTYRTNGLEFFLNASVNRDNTLTRGTTTNTLVYEGKETMVGSSRRNSYPVTAGTAKAGFSYTGGSRSLGAYYRYNPEWGNFTNTGAEWLDSNPVLTRDIGRRIRSHSHLASVYYEDKFSGKYLFHFDGDFSTSSADNRTSASYHGTEAPDVSSTERRFSALLAGKLYLTMPLWKGDLTAGTCDSHTRTSVDYHMLNTSVGEYIPSAFTSVRQTSAALFASWTRVFGSLSVSAGVRYEYVDYDFMRDGQRDDNISRRDHMLTPDISLGYSFSDDAQLSASYKTATVRPPYAQLTGTLSYVGLHEIEGGNIALHDERIHDMQIFGMWKSFMFQGDFMRSRDTYAFVKERYPASSLQLLMHPVNVDVSAISLYLIWNKPIRRWTPDVTVGMYRQWLTIGHTACDSPIFSYYFDNTVSLPHGWIITAGINGSTGGDMHTNRLCSNLFTMNAAITKTFLGKSLTIRLAATDIFNTARNDWTMDTYGIHVDKHQRYDRRGMALSITYDFQPRKSGYKGSPASESEMNRL